MLHMTELITQWPCCDLCSDIASTRDRMDLVICAISSLTELLFLVHAIRSFVRFLISAHSQSRRFKIRKSARIAILNCKYLGPFCFASNSLNNSSELDNLLPLFMMSSEKSSNYWEHRTHLYLWLRNIRPSLILNINCQINFWLNSASPWIYFGTRILVSWSFKCKNLN